MSKQNVLHVVDGLHPKRGGVPTAVLNISNLLNRMDLEYSILSIGDNPELHIAHCIYFPSETKFGYSKEALLWFEQNFKNFNVIHFHCIWNITVLLLYKRALKAKIKYYISPHGSLDPFDIKKKYYLKKILGLLMVNKFLVNAKYIFCTSAKEKSRLEYFGKSSDNAVVLPLPVEYAHKQLERSKSFRDKYCLEENAFVFLFMSRINYKKGLLELINVIEILVGDKTRPINNFRLLIAGDDNNSYARKIKKKVNSSNLNALISFIGLLTGNEKLEAFTNSDVFILPSQNENFGLSIIESLQTGTPILISENVYIHTELFTPVINSPGWLCKGDLSNLTEKFLEALTDSQISLKINNAFIKGDMFKTKPLKDIYLPYFTHSE